jgi:hypothetical protein
MGEASRQEQKLGPIELSVAFCGALTENASMPNVCDVPGQLHRVGVYTRYP